MLPLVTYFTVKCLYSAHLAQHHSAAIRTSLEPEAPRLPLRPAGHNLVNPMYNDFCGLDTLVAEEADNFGLAPRLFPLPDVTYTDH